MQEDPLEFESGIWWTLVPKDPAVIVGRAVLYFDDVAVLYVEPDISSAMAAVRA